MKKCRDWSIGVCSWSLRAGVDEVADAMRKLEISHVHLAVGPAFKEDGEKYLSAIREQDWAISSTMIDYPQEDYSTLESIKVTGGIGPDESWAQNRELSLRAIGLTAELGVKYLSTHVGFLDHTDPAYAKKFYDRVKCLADAAGEKKIMLLMETGQETAEDLRRFLEEMNHPALGVNFDPANMILYGKGTPNEAVKVLSPWIKHVHIKDAVETQTPGTWGAEVPWGEGQVGGESFLKVLGGTGFTGVLAIEREAGETRFEDIKLAVGRLSN